MSSQACAISHIQPLRFVSATINRCKHLHIITRVIMLIQNQIRLTCLSGLVMVHSSAHFVHAGGSFSGGTALSRTRGHEFHWARFYLFNVCFAYFLVDICYLRIDVKSL